LRPAEPVLAALEIRYELTILNAYRRSHVQALHDRREIQIVHVTEPSRTEPVITVVSGTVVHGAERHGGRI
jgi:hypothetical protein